jgi:1-phosphofructokinase
MGRACPANGIEVIMIEAMRRVFQARGRPQGAAALWARVRHKLLRVAFMSSESSPVVCVVAPEPQLIVEIEQGPSGGSPEIHVHPGGQGLWIARMASSLGARVVVCGPFGGETGTVAAYLAEAEGLRIRRTSSGSNRAVVQDRRQGDQAEVLVTALADALDRHALDDLYGTALATALDADICVLTGSEQDVGVPADFHGRLTRDLAASGIDVVADLSGAAAAAVAKEDIAVLKISHEELVEGEFAADDSEKELRRAAERMIEHGPRAVVVSRAQDPTLVVTSERAYTLTAPPVTTVEHRGAGDSMTAGIAAGLARGLDLPDAVRLGAAAGALNVTRHGLGTGRRDQIEGFAERVTVQQLDPA